MDRQVCTVYLNGSPSSRRAWIEIGRHRTESRRLSVALLAEGVDRNCVPGQESRQGGRVALLAEGVDRNSHWEEELYQKKVALLAEGVDRNPDLWPVSLG